jgi:hypothetical protein
LRSKAESALKPPAAAWETAWKEAEAKAADLLKEERFADAMAAYTDAASRSEDARFADKVQKAIAAIVGQAKAAHEAADSKARQLLADKKFDEARAAIRPVVERHGVPGRKEKAQDLLAEIDKAEKADRESTAKTTEDAAAKAERERREAEAKARQQAEAAFAKALEPVEALAATWDFSAALTALEAAATRLAKEDPTLFGPPAPDTRHPAPFFARLATRRDELARLAALKARMIAKINSSTPRLDKRALLIPGINAPIEKADERAITARPEAGNPEHFAWPDLTPKTLDRLIALTINKDSPDDWLSAGILHLTRVAQPPSAVGASAAEEAFEKAKSLGASIDRYLAPLASAAFVSANSLLDKKDFPAAESALAALEKKYEKAPWLAAHKDDVASAREAAKTGIAEGEAEKLYAEAARLFERKELFDLKPIIEKLKTDYSKTRPVTDAARKPSFAEMLEATETLGKFITVRKDARGNFKTIRDALDAAPQNSLIEIQDSGPYMESLRITKEGTTLRGRKGQWPVITSLGRSPGSEVLVHVSAPRTTIGRLLLLHGTPGGNQPACVMFDAPSFRLVSCLVQIPARTEQGAGTFTLLGKSVGTLEVEDCVFSGHAYLQNARSSVNGCLWLKDGLMMAGENQFVHCTIPGTANFHVGSGALLESIVDSVGGTNDVQVDRCDVYGSPPYTGRPKPGKNSFIADPQFRDPANFDYRLKPTSPCRKKASDGGDIGCRYSPEMLEMLEKALELRKKGIIKF